jgi:hypothetical protein
VWLAHMQRGHAAGPWGEAKQRDQTAEPRRQDQMEKPDGEAITEARL